MNIYKMSKEELELLSYTDIAYEILKKEKTHKTTIELLRTIAELLELSDDVIAQTIGDFYTTLTTDKRFYALPNGEWDLKERHTTKVIIDDDDDFDVDVDDVDTNDDDENQEDDSMDYDSTDDYEENDLEDLVVVTEDDESYDG
ncbi:MAG: DNA-directed RNA polymerase subunit delta [Bacilli bacterium]|nr:DNA-directed RNA polymerase subunit delta [Bacilli bacterium]